MAKFSFVKVFIVFVLVFNTFYTVSAFRIIQDKGKTEKIKKSDLIKEKIEQILNKTNTHSELKSENKANDIPFISDKIQKKNKEFDTKILTKKKPKLETKIVTKSVTNETDFNEMLKKIEEIKLKETKSKIVEKNIEQNIKQAREERKEEIKQELLKKKLPKIDVKTVSKIIENITEPISTVVKTLRTKQEEKQEDKKIKQVDKIAKPPEKVLKEEEKAVKIVKKEIILPEKVVDQIPLAKVRTSDKQIKPKIEPKKETPKPELKKEPPKPEPKKEPLKPEPKKEPAKPEPKKEPPKPEPKKEPPKPEPKKEPPKPETKKVPPKLEPQKVSQVPKTEVKRVPEVPKKEPTKPKIDEKSKSIKAVKSDKPDVKNVKPVPSTKTSKPAEVPKVKKETVKRIVNEEFSDFIYMPDFSVVDNEQCKKQGLLAIENFNNGKMWAIKMYDASAKIPSNILKGNLNQLGDFDECLGIHAKIPLEDGSRDKENVPIVRISGKYCLAYIDLEATIQEMKLPVNLAQGRAFIRSRNTDPGHFIPRFTSIRWGVCVPSTCTNEDVEKILEDMLPKNSTLGVNFGVYVPKDECQTSSKWDLHYMTFATMGLMFFLVTTTVTATVRDYITDVPSVEDTSYQMWMSFSLKRTTTAFLQDSRDEIPCIHGIRAVCTILLYVAHKLIPVGHSLYSNRVVLTEISNNPLSIILRMSVIYTDTFLLLSGVLTAYHMSKDMETKGSIPWLNRIFARIIRLSPILLVVLLYYAYIMDITGTGPLWPSIITENSELCQNNWWKNLLFIQNMYPFEEMCATHTHQLALDMQLFLIAPILVWLLYSRPFLGVVTTLLLHILSVVLRYYTTLNYRLSLVIYHGISMSQLYRTANLLYASTLHRMTPYLAGIGLGVLLRQLSPEARIPKVISILGWFSAMYFIGWTMYTPSHLAQRNYQYDSTEAAQFSALCSLAWALALSWIIFASFTNATGYLNQFLSSKPMVILSKLSYTMYLIQFLIFFYNVGTIRTSSEFKLTEIANVPEFIIVTSLSLVMFLVVDLPTQKIKNILIRPSPNETKNTVEVETKTEEEQKEEIEENVKSEAKEEQTEVTEIIEVSEEISDTEDRDFSEESSFEEKDLTEELDDIEELDELEERDDLEEIEDKNFIDVDVITKKEIKETKEIAPVEEIEERDPKEVLHEEKDLIELIDEIIEEENKEEDIKKEEEKPVKNNTGRLPLMDEILDEELSDKE